MEPVAVAIHEQGREEDAWPNAGVSMAKKACVGVRRRCVCMQGSVADGHGMATQHWMTLDGKLEGLKRLEGAGEITGGLSTRNKDPFTSQNVSARSK